MQFSGLQYALDIGTDTTVLRFDDAVGVLIGEQPAGAAVQAAFAAAKRQLLDLCCSDAGPAAVYGALPPELRGAMPRHTGDLGGAFIAAQVVAGALRRAAYEDGHAQVGDRRVRLSYLDEAGLCHYIHMRDAGGFVAECERLLRR